MARKPAEVARALADAALEERPGLGGSAAEFARHLEALAASTAEPAIELAELRIGDLYLAWCCGRGCAPALERLWTEHVPVLRQTVRAMTKDDGSADDIIQDVLKHVLVGTTERAPAIRSYEGRSKLGRWLRSVTVRAALAKRAQSGPVAAGDDATLLVPSSLEDPELAVLKQHTGDTVERALRQALESLDLDQRLVLQQHLVDGLSIDQLAAIYQIHRATAARRIAKARDALLTATRRQLRETTRLVGNDLDSLIRFAQSRVRLSLRSFAGSPGVTTPE
jgi:RNA polymerase sigma-70 factor (ECF subfamily)